MKKVLFALLVVGLVASCSKSSVSEEENQIGITNDEFQNQIQGVDGDKIKRPGSGSN